MDIDIQSVEHEQHHVLDTVEGEIHFFRALMRARPVGMHRHFHVMAMQNAIEKGTKAQVSIGDIWQKLESCYNLEALEALETDYEANSSSTSTPQPPSSPTPADNLATHPFFREEFSLPADPLIEQEIAKRRLRPPGSSSSTPGRNSPEPAKTGKRGRRRKPSKVNKADLAGLVSGDSDSSALTQESAEEEAPESPADRRAASVVTGTDGGTEDLQFEEGEDVDQDTTKRPRKGGRKPNAGGRARTVSNARIPRKRKR